MSRYLAFAASLWLVGCAGPSVSNLQTDSDTSVTVASLSQIREIDLTPMPYAEEVVCEMVAPTGTRIAKERCYVRNPELDETRAEVRRTQIDSLREGARRLEDEYIKSVFNPREGPSF